MSKLDLVRSYSEYHCAMTRHVLESCAQISAGQFLQEEAYSRGLLHNLLVHLISTDRRWLAGLKNMPDAGHLNFADYPSLASVRAVFEEVAQELADYIAVLSEAELEQPPAGLPNPRWQILLHLVNHGTDHRATVLQRLAEFGAPTFDQDFILWLWSQK
jgi:uncharacterized damage-inducible protein DinB